ncbi:hypothetical protein CHS0354_020434 [Potamilus streckersoni]|uniref:Uncharacterized protein n=1 Tax=Potamilus streckersoni TaxID=2493646 RepID=A0AAE0SLW5_9BIVA|nr:hypothetical protein CHS0354_020434 [Potamilus streckersoni]
MSLMLEALHHIDLQLYLAALLNDNVDFLNLFLLAFAQIHSHKLVVPPTDINVDLFYSGKKYGRKNRKLFFLIFKKDIEEDECLL